MSWTNYYDGAAKLNDYYSYHTHFSSSWLSSLARSKKWGAKMRHPSVHKILVWESSYSFSHANPADIFMDKIHDKNLTYSPWLANISVN